MKILRWAGAVALALMLSDAPALAQSGSSAAFPAGFAPGMAPCVVQADGTCKAVQVDTNPLPVASKRETFQLVASNVPSAPVTLYGGDYVFSQTCSAYGTLTLQVLGPDGATYQTMVSKTSSDTAGGMPYRFGSNAVVRSTVSGTTACNASISR